MADIESVSRPARPQRRRALSGWLLLAAAAALATTGCAAWRIGQSIELARRSERFEQKPPAPKIRLLIVGDSTGVGTGASTSANSLAGLIASGHPALLVENRSHDGARFSDVLTQLAEDQRFDIVLVLAGGNDVIRLRALDDLRLDVARVAAAAAARAPRVLLMPSGNVGNAPFFFAPLSWLMMRRSRALHGFVADSAAQNGATYINLFREAADDPFVKEPVLNASDGLHPSDAGYRFWWRELQKQGGLEALLAPARGVLSGPV